MRARKWILARAAAASLLLLSAMTVIGADPKPASQLPDPPRTEVYMAQFRLWFDRGDLDKDGYLDKEELAKIFRGPNAHPYDYVPPKITPGEKKTDDKADPAKPDDKKDPAKPDDKKDPAAKPDDKKDPAPKADDKKDPAKPDDKKDPAKPDDSKDPGKSSSESNKDPKKLDYTKFPDYVFLIQLDQDMDGKISRDEFLSWARDIAVQMRDQADAAAALAQAQANLAKYSGMTNSAAYKKALNTLKQQEKQAAKAAAQLAKAQNQLAAMQLKALKQ
jgi:hypothetical protein